MKYIIGFIIGLSLVAGVAKAEGAHWRWTTSIWPQYETGKVDIYEVEEGGALCYVATGDIYDGYSSRQLAISCK